MKITKLLDIKKECMISIVGAGGKSTLMYSIAEELRKDRKCLVTTTTKIFIPEEDKYDLMAIGSESFGNLKQASNNGVYVYGSSTNSEGKLIGINPSELLGQLAYFDNIIIEADGSRMKMVKGWLDSEPVICADSTQTIGVLSIEAIGKKINNENVHRVTEFINITKSNIDNLITIEDLASIINHPLGLFKNAVGEKILFINKVGTVEQINDARKLVDFTRKNNINIERIFIGSLKSKTYIQI